MPAKGYGTQLANVGVIDPEPPASPPEERSADDLKAIRERVAAPIVEQKFLLNFTAAESTAAVIKTVDASQFAINSIVVNVLTGTLDFWLGDDASAGGTPDFRFTNVGQPVQVLLPLKTRRFSFLANGGAVTGKMFIQCL